MQNEQEQGIDITPFLISFSLTLSSFAMTRSWQVLMTKLGEAEGKRPGVSFDLTMLSYLWQETLRLLSCFILINMLCNFKTRKDQFCQVVSHLLNWMGEARNEDIVTTNRARVSRCGSR